jgi:hypothetical protein
MVGAVLIVTLFYIYIGMGSIGSIGGLVYLDLPIVYLDLVVTTLPGPAMLVTYRSAVRNTK